MTAIKKEGSNYATLNLFIYLVLLSGAIHH
nr:MAG TPA: hypothetical protein [Caudoviricetes sp.]DAW30727.1 MAG TPA: hypothetical protein [Caudoviricetes sp.]